jgi:hypothetical protein
MGLDPPVPPAPPSRPSIQPINGPTLAGPVKPAAPTSERPEPSPPQVPPMAVRRTFWKTRDRTGTRIEMMTVDVSAKRAALWSRYDIPIRGDVLTDLKPGYYTVAVDAEKREWQWPADGPKRFIVKFFGLQTKFDVVAPATLPVIAYEGFPASGPGSFEETKKRVVDHVSGGRFVDAWRMLDELDDLGLHEVVDEVWIDHAQIIVDLLRAFQKGVKVDQFDMMRSLRAIESYSVESQRRLYVDSFLDAYLHPSTWVRDREREAAKLSNVKIGFTYNAVPQRAITFYADDIKDGVDHGSEPPHYDTGELFFPHGMNQGTTPRMHAAKKRLVAEIERQNVEFIKQAWQGVELTITLVLAGVTVTAGVTEAVAASVRAAPIAGAVALERQMGSWIADFEAGQNMAEADALYQMRAGNAPGRGMGFYRGTVQFDGRELATKSLIEVKNWKDGGRMANALSKGQYWAGNKVLQQGVRQVGASGGYQVVWRVSGRQAADLIQQIFRNNKVPIQVVFFP